MQGGHSIIRFKNRKYIQWYWTFQLADKANINF